jgi:hypothetical protein
MKLRVSDVASLAALMSLLAGGSQAATQFTSQGVTGLATAVSEGAPTNTASADSVGGLQMPAVRVVEAAATVPEPAGWAMLLLGFGGLGVVLRHRRRAHPA